MKLIINGDSYAIERADSTMFFNGLERTRLTVTITDPSVSLDQFKKYKNPLTTLRIEDTNIEDDFSGYQIDNVRKSYSDIIKANLTIEFSKPNFSDDEI